MTIVRVITPTSTFYPQITQQQEDQTIRSMVIYLNTSTNCNLQYFRTNQRTIVFSSWSNILFFISGTNESVYYLRFRLQLIREIAVFLFGLKFAEIMSSNTISVGHVNIFSTYVDAFLKLTETDFKSQLAIISHESSFSETSRSLSEVVPTSKVPSDLQLVECIIFRDNKIIARLVRPGPPPICYIDIFLLSLYARIEYPEPNSIDHNNDDDDDDIEMNHDVVNFDPNYVNKLSPPSVQHRAGFLSLNSLPQQCSIASTRLGKNSPYVALFVTQDPRASEKRDVIMNILGLIANAMDESAKIPASISLSSPGLVYFLVVSRTNGECWEFETSSDPKSHEITEKLFKTMKNKSLEALMNGQTTLMWKDTHFLFSYMLKFINSHGQIIIPNNRIKLQPFSDDYNISYSEIGADAFPNENNLHIFEIYSIFLGTIPPKIAYNENSQLFIDVLKLRPSPLSFGMMQKSNSSDRNNLLGIRGLKASRLNNSQSSVNVPNPRLLPKVNNPKQQKIGSLVRPRPIS